MSKSALIFGASGVTGWSFVNELLNDYPKAGIWSKVHALTNRPLSQEQSQWPKDSRLNIVSGIDLLKGSQEELEQALKSRIDGIENVTHVYYLAYKAGTDLQKELEEAVSMFKRSTIAMDKLSKKLEFVVLQTGAKMCMCILRFFQSKRRVFASNRTSRWLPPARKPPYRLSTRSTQRIAAAPQAALPRHALLSPANGLGDRIREKQILVMVRHPSGYHYRVRTESELLLTRHRHGYISLPMA